MIALIPLLLLIVAVVAIGLAAFWLIARSVPAPAQMPARLVVGVILLIVLLTQSGLLPIGALT